jgi:AcrR family transcriptional regulator
METNGETRQQILGAALKRFADAGYAGTSVQDIVNAASVTKPTLYYHFQNKAGLYQALVDRAHDERLRLMQEAATRADSLPEKLIEILAALFEFLQNNRELMRIAFMTLFASAGEIPSEIRYLDKCTRNYEFIHSLIKQGQVENVLTKQVSSDELAMAIFGMLNIYVMGDVLRQNRKLNRRMAERIVALFLEGAAASKMNTVSNFRT